jgi:O-antigen/teichoic acid export membrane protein
MSNTFSRRRLVLSGGLWFAASQILPLVSTAVLSIVVGNVLGPDGLGRQALISYAESSISSVLVWGLTYASIQTLAALRGKDDLNGSSAMCWWSFRAHLILGSGTGILLLGIGLMRTDNPLDWGLVGLTALTNAWSWAYGSQIAATRGWAPIGQRRLTTQLFATCFGALAILLGGTISWIFIGNILGAAWLALSLRRLLPRDKPLHSLLPVAGFSHLWMMLALIQLLTQVVMNRSEYFILDTYWTSSEIAMYSIAFMLVAAAAAASTAVTGAVMPVIAAANARGEQSAIREHLARTMRLVSVLSVVACAALVALGPGLVRLLYGNDFDRAAPLVRIAALGILVLPISGLCNDYWSGRGQLNGILLAGSIAGVFGIGSALLLIPSQGALGAVVANLTGQVVLGVAVVAITWRATGKFKWHCRRLLTMVMVGAIAAFCGNWTETAVGGILGLIAAGILTLLILMVGMYFGRVLGADDARWFSSILPSTFRRPVQFIGRVRSVDT